MEIQRWDGQPISKPGCYRGIPIKTYHSGKLCIGPSISSSGLRTIFSRSPAHYWAQSPHNPKRKEKPDSEALIMGRAVHHVLLGEPSFREQFVIRPDEAPDGRAWNGNNGSCKKWLKEAADAGLTVLTGVMIENIKGMALSLGKEPLIAAGALNGAVECTFAWQDEETGVWLLARPDNTATDSADYVDLKTTVSVAYNDLVYTLGEYGYVQQGALVGEGHKAITGEDMSSFSLYFVEKEDPYCADMRQLKLEDLERGRKMNRLSIRTFAKCWNAKVWPGPNGMQGDVSHIELSDKAQERIDKRLAEEGIA